jgi:hypothetical protein
MLATTPSTPQLSDIQSHQAPVGPPKNISSNELEEQEASQIASELKRQLNEGSTAPANAVSATTGTLPFQAAKPQEDGPKEGDTIYIDRDGNMSMNQSTPADEQKPAQ